MSKTTTGGCQCGAVRFETTAEPVFSAVCHCRQCQRASGAPSSAFVAVPKQAVSISGEVRYFETKGGSGNPVRRGFCPTCGSRLFGIADVAPDLMGISSVSFDDPSDFSPQMHIFTENAQPWDRIGGELPVFPGMPPMGGD
jgi:hypothetical protein